ncbi:MAG TPA: sigma-70 family RNA polymerase sigma factor [Solirubrobacterales bacterium]|nr:sigma-70 family RNA polymerase sigma factor [Solirubrobacterales bacterium]
MSSLLSDQRLVQRAADGEERAFAAIFDRYHQPLYRYCMAIVGDSQDAQDALQNAMLKVLRALPGEQREIKLKPWLYRIAHNESVDLLRRRRDTRELDAELAAPGPPLADELSSRERLRQLLTDLDELPERQHGALVMRELAGLDFDEIATALDTSPAVARQTLYEARLSLHQMDEGRGMDCAAVTQALSDDDGRVVRRRDIRAHLRTCSDCRRFGEGIEGRERDFASLAPLPAVVAGGLLHALLGGSAAGGAGGGAVASGGGAVAGTAVAGGAMKMLGTSATLKGAAAILAVAAIGTGAAQRGGLIDLGLPGDGRSKAPMQRSTEAAPPSAGSQADDAPSGSSVTLPSRLAQGKVAKKKQQQGVQAGAPGGTATAEGASGGASPGARQTEAAAHLRGKGHEKQHPAAAAHGQQTAAAHKNTSQGAGGGREHPAHPPKPSHPSPPSQPTSGKSKPAPGKEKAAPKGSAPTPEASPNPGSAAPGAPAEEVAAQPEPSQKP